MEITSHVEDHAPHHDPGWHDAEARHRRRAGPTLGHDFTTPASVRRQFSTWLFEYGTPPCPYEVEKAEAIPGSSLGSSHRKLGREIAFHLSAATGRAWASRLCGEKAFLRPCGLPGVVLVLEFVEETDRIGCSG